MNHRRALIIDDEDDIREVVTISLEMMDGWEVLSASSGPTGILIAQAERPDVILLDVMMPGMDGKATFSELQSHDATRGIPVVFLTAKVQPSDRVAYLRLGVRGVISKPFDPLTLAAEMLASMSTHVSDRHAGVSDSDEDYALRTG